uniref:Uncharacterized protein n=1 Tax=Triticum urartu TaxID=4572 RepID=A0A8R7UZ96_TRIUA
ERKEGAERWGTERRISGRWRRRRRKYWRLGATFFLLPHPLTGLTFGASTGSGGKYGLGADQDAEAVRVERELLKGRTRLMTRVAAHLGCLEHIRVRYGCTVKFH